MYHIFISPYPYVHAWIGAGVAVVREELRPWGRSFSAIMQGRFWRRIDMALLDLAVNGEACA